ncbi:MAG: insulinase family protein [Desulfobulbaceae bacterium]|nr:insulinase family protein [Candidatus Kapabacteria bacterium]MBS3999658.1 insulinase family protein [Desulfobulbaceae bacterium]
MKNKNNLQETKTHSLEITRTVLNNGLTLVTEKIPHAESIALGIFVNAGSRDDSPDYSGTAHFMEHAVFRRSQKRTSRRIAGEFESMGAYTNAFTSQEYTCFYVRALKKHFRKTLNILFDITINPLLLQKEIEKEQLIILEEIKSYEDDPEEYIFDLGDKILFQNHPLGNPIIGTKESVGEINSDVLQQFHREYYKPDNIIITFVGDIEHQVVLNAISNLFGALDAGYRVYTRIAPEPFAALTLEMAKPVQQSHLLLGKRAASLKDEDRTALMIFNILFGDGMSSRLYQKLRDRHGIAYSIFSTLQMHSDAGVFYIYAATDTKKVRITETMIFEQMNQILNDKLNRSEINRAKEQLKSSLIMDLESMSARMQSLAKNELLIGDHESVREIIERIDAITLVNVKETAAKYFGDGSWSKAHIYPEK